MSEETSTVLCLWCRRVMDWGKGPIAWDLCERCLPGVLEALEARLGGPDGGSVERSRQLPTPCGAGRAASAGGAALPAW